MELKNTFLIIALVCSAMSVVTSILSYVLRSKSMYKLGYNKKVFPDLIITNEDYHRVLFGTKMLSSAMTYSITGVSAHYEDELSKYYHKELHKSFRFIRKQKRRKYQRITTFNTITMLRKEFKI